jgi:hypothetical protein
MKESDRDWHDDGAVSKGELESRLRPRWFNNKTQNAYYMSSRVVAVRRAYSDLASCKA